MIVIYKWIDTKINMLRMEIDYELMSLHDAIQQDDTPTQNECKERLRELSENLKVWESNLNEQ